jgi:hypothetical protein
MGLIAIVHVRKTPPEHFRSAKTILGPKTLADRLTMISVHVTSTPPA